ncbi:MAG: histidine phosphatase family protein [Halothiobacillus sp.]|nr:histidine phosphatase family protein [Halothiobacillus sp.]
MALILLRHAPPPLRWQGSYLGHSDIDIDTSLFDKTKIEPLMCEQFDRIYSSDLIRCTHTLDAMGLQGYLTDRRLREVRFKPSFEGKTFAQIERMGEYDPAALVSEEAWHRFVCDESPEAFRHRIGSFLAELDPKLNILLCTHAGTIKTILSLLRLSEHDRIPAYLDYVRIPLWGYNKPEKR